MQRGFVEVKRNFLSEKVKPQKKSVGRENKKNKQQRANCISLCETDCIARAPEEGSSGAKRAAEQNAEILLSSEDVVSFVLPPYF